MTFLPKATSTLPNESTGAYLAGDLSGVTDVVRVTDRACADEVLISIDIVQPMQVLPGQPSVPRGQTVRFEVSEGSGEYEFSWLDNHSGGELEVDGTYFSGDILGQDRYDPTDTLPSPACNILWERMSTNR